MARKGKFIEIENRHGCLGLGVGMGTTANGHEGSLGVIDKSSNVELW